MKKAIELLKGKLEELKKETRELLSDENAFLIISGYIQAIETLENEAGETYDPSAMKLLKEVRNEIAFDLLSSIGEEKWRLKLNYQK